MSKIVPDSIVSILKRLRAIAEYAGPWQALRSQVPLLAQRLDELHERETRLDDLLVIALVGGSGVGKSTLLNALAGDELAKTSEFRPCTAIPTVYHPPGARLEFAKGWSCVSGSALESLVIIDTPDSDTIATEHRERVLEALAQCDLIFVCADTEKYLDEATWSLLRPLRNERSFVCIETKASDGDSIREHWLGRLNEEGFETGGYFRVNSLRTLDRKLAGSGPNAGEYDFGKLEDFLRDELTRERIARIKRSNVAGLLNKTLEQLRESLADPAARIHDLTRAVEAAEHAQSNDTFELIRSRLFAEPHLWVYAMGREMSLRAKGFALNLFRIVEYARTIPPRVVSMGLWSMKFGAGQQAASLLTDRKSLNESLEFASDALADIYRSRHKELALELAKAGFDVQSSDEVCRKFTAGVSERVGRVLRGPARDRIVSSANTLKSWPLAMLLDLPLLAFAVYCSYRTVHAFFFSPTSALLPAAFFLHALAVFGILLGSELLLLSAAVRIAAWKTRRTAVADLRNQLLANQTAFAQQRNDLREALALVNEVKALQKVLEGEST